MKRRDMILKAVASAAALSSGGVLAQGQTYPSRPIKIVVPFPAGTSPDAISRLLADKLSQAWGQPVYIENRAGAAGAIGAEAVSTSAADGYTMLYTVSSIMEINPHVYANLRYNPLTDFASIIQTTTIPYVLCATPTAPFSNMRELVDYAKRNPGVINYASYGVGSQTQVAVEMWSKRLGIQLNHIPYASNPATDLMSGAVSLLLEPATTAIPLIKGNKVKAIAVSGEQRIATLPNVAPASDYMAGLQTISWHGMFLPKGAPANVVEKLNGEIARILALPDVRARFLDWGLSSAGGTPEELTGRVAAGHATWGRAIKELGIKLQ